MALAILAAVGSKSFASTATNAADRVDLVYTSTQPEAPYSFQSGLVSLDLVSGRRTWLVSDGEAEEPSLSADGRTLAFARDGVWIARSDGSEARRVVNDEFASWPALSPDGERVSYSDDGLWVVEVDSGAKQRVHPRGAVSNWSPDGRRLVFDERTRIYVINADGTGARPLTSPGSNVNDDDPAWSPDGRSIAFIRDSDVHVVSSEGGAPQRLTRTRQFESVSWSPDSRKLVFEGSFEIYSMNADGTAQRRLTRNDTYEGQPIWAPNGRVVFESAPDSEIFVRRGTRAIQLTDNDASDGAVAWSPNGSRMAYSSGQSGRHAVYLMRRDGAGQRELTRTTSQVQTLEWSPSGDRLLAVTGGGALLVDTSSGALAC